MSLFSNIQKYTIASIIVTLAPQISHALELTGVYLSSCNRVIGIISQVTPSRIEILDIKGTNQVINRYEINALTSYPVDFFPRADLHLKDTLSHRYQIFTKVKNEILPFVTGWPIYYSEDQISFLSSMGDEVVIERNSIWDIVSEDNIENKKIHFEIKNNREYDFLHPTPLRKCIKDKVSSNSIEVAPQAFSVDPVFIKRKLDTYIDEQQTLKNYERSKSFYAKPLIYENKTTLGIWMAANSRYGASKTRTNNWTPILENQFSTGPFGFQHLFFTGASTNDYATIDEPQTQIFYKFKADYFHFGLYIDPNLVLLGERYRWFNDEMGVGEFKINDMQFVEMGFDIGKFSLLSQFTAENQIGYKESSKIFYDGSLTVPKIGFEYTFPLQKFVFLMGSTNENVVSDKIYDNSGNEIGTKISKFNFNILRFNYHLQLSDPLLLSLIYIKRDLTLTDNKISSSTYSSILEYKYSYKYIFKLLLSNERVSNDIIGDQSFIKMALNANLVF